MSTTHITRTTVKQFNSLATAKKFAAAEYGKSLATVYEPDTDRLSYNSDAALLAIYPGESYFPKFRSAVQFSSEDGVSTVTIDRSTLTKNEDCVSATRFAAGELATAISKEFAAGDTVYAAYDGAHFELVAHPSEDTQYSRFLAVISED